MQERIFLTEEQIVALNLRALRKDRGIHGVFSRDLLASGTAMPQVTFGGPYLHQSIEAMAAA